MFLLKKTFLPGDVQKIRDFGSLVIFCNKIIFECWSILCESSSRTAGCSQGLGNRTPWTALLRAQANRRTFGTTRQGLTNRYARDRKLNHISTTQWQCQHTYLVDSYEKANFLRDKTAVSCSCHADVMLSFLLTHTKSQTAIMVRYLNIQNLYPRVGHVYSMLPKQCRTHTLEHSQIYRATHQLLS